MHSANKACSSQDGPKVGQEKERRQRRREGREEVLRAPALGMAPMPEQGQCCLYDPQGASDSVAESDEECPGSILQEGALG